MISLPVSYTTFRSEDSMSRALDLGEHVAVEKPGWWHPVLRVSNVLVVAMIRSARNTYCRI